MDQITAIGCWQLAGVFALGMLPYLIYRWHYNRTVHAQFIVTGCVMTTLMAAFYICGILASVCSVIGFFLKFGR
jgi:hypothetical protein